MSLSEIMTILIAFHQSHYRTLVSRYNGSQTRKALTRNFKRYYLDHVCVYWLSEFPRLPSYQRASLMLPELRSGHTKRVYRVDAINLITIVR